MCVCSTSKYLFLLEGNNRYIFFIVASSAKAKDTTRSKTHTHTMLGSLMPISVKIKWKFVFGAVLLVGGYFAVKYGMKKIGKKVRESESQTAQEFDDANLPKKVYAIEFELKGLTGTDVVDVYVDNVPYVEGKILMKDEWEAIRFVTKELSHEPLDIAVHIRMPGSRVAFNKSIMMNDKECFNPDRVASNLECRFNKEDGVISGIGACMFRLPNAP